eukprot:s246_g31.t1
MPGLLLLGARARCGSRKGKRIGHKLGPFALLVLVALRRVRAPWRATRHGPAGGLLSSPGQQQLTDRAGGERRRGRAKSRVDLIAGGVGPIGGLSRGGPFGPSWFMLPIGLTPLPALGCPGMDHRIGKGATS